MKKIFKKIKDRVSSIHPLIPIIIFSLLLLINISKQYLWTDEVFSYTAAKMIAEKGEPLYDAGLMYLRAPIYHQTVALVFKYISESILSSRVINVVFSLVTSAFIYNFFKHRDRRIGVLASVIFLTTNFTLAMVRETRMYAMTVMFLTASIYFLYNAVKELDIKKTLLQNINKRIVVNTSISALLLFATYNTHPSAGAIGLGLILFFAIWAIQTRSRLLLYLLLISTALFLGALYQQYSTLSPSLLIEKINPAWADENFSRIYYSILLFRNLPFIILAAPLILGAIMKRNLLTLLTFSLATGYIFVISNQPAQQERYLVVAIPLLIVSAVEALTSVNWKKEISTGIYKLFSVALLFSLIFHLFLYIKEHREISTYTPTSISIHKKFDFEKAMQVIDEYPKDVEIIADYHSAFTLHFYGYNVKRILVQEQHPDIQHSPSDIYFNIPFITYGQHLNDEISDPEKDVLVIRDIRDLKLLDKEGIEKNRELSEPAIYKEL